MTKDQIIDKLYWLVYNILQEYGTVYVSVKNINDMINQVYDIDIIKQYPEYKYVIEDVDKSNNKVNHYEELFRDIGKKLKELAD